MKRIIYIILFVSALMLCFASCREEPENWTHKTFQGTVTNIWEEDGQQLFSIRHSIGEDAYNVYSFVISEETLYTVPFGIGDEVLVESDYDRNAHNGTSVPYPAVLIADPDITDKP